MKKDGQVFAWGLSELFSNSLRGFIERPINLTKELQKEGDGKINKIEAGYKFTAIVRVNN